MGPAIDGMNVVGEGQHILREAVVVLQRSLDAGGVDDSLDVDRALVQYASVAIQVAHEARDASLEIEVLLAICALVAQADPEPLVQVRGLAQPGRDQVPAEVEGLEDLAVGEEVGAGACAPVSRRYQAAICLKRSALLAHRAGWRTPAVFLDPALSIAQHLHLH